MVSYIGRAEWKRIPHMDEQNNTSRMIMADFLEQVKRLSKTVTPSVRAFSAADWQE